MTFKVYTSQTFLVSHIATLREYGRSLIPWPNNTLLAAPHNLTSCSGLLKQSKILMNTCAQKSPAQNTSKSLLPFSEGDTQKLHSAF